MLRKMSCFYLFFQFLHNVHMYIFFLKFTRFARVSASSLVDIGSFILEGSSSRYARVDDSALLDLTTIRILHFIGRWRLEISFLTTTYLFVIVESWSWLQYTQNGHWKYLSNLWYYNLHHTRNMNKISFKMAVIVKF